MKHQVEPMRLSKISIANFRSIKNLSEVRIEPLQGFVGENDAGKSNVLRALNCFLGSGAGGADRDDFNNATIPIVIEAEFSGLSALEKKKLRPYLLGDRLILQKRISLTTDSKSSKNKLVSEYHGYQADPKDYWLSTDKIVEQHGARPKWEQIAEEHGILEFVKTNDGKITKASYQSGVDRILLESDDIEYEEAELGKTHALGLQPNLLSALPDFYLLPAITDYSDEIDSRSSTTVFRRLMADLSERLVSKDPRYAEIETAIKNVNQLLNVNASGQDTARLASLSDIEEKILSRIQRLMPTVKAIHLGVEVDTPKDVFSRGVNIRVDDGVITDVLQKGNGMQRSIVFSLLQLLMDASREAREGRSIILAIEEPELYIHPQSQRLIFKVLKDFAGVQKDESAANGNDQVLYTTHSASFIDIGRYEQIAGIRKENATVGTIAKQCDPGILGTVDEKKGFKLLTSFGLKHNELFFSRHSILVEGSQDEIAVIATARKLGKIDELPDELRMSVAVTGSKGQLPKFQKVLNAFGLSYSVLLEMDGKGDTDPENKAILDLVGPNLVSRLPNKLENTVALDRHFHDDFEAKQFFNDPVNISPELEAIVEQLFPATPNINLQAQAANAATAGLI